jgi:amino acid transporter
MIPFAVLNIVYWAEGVIMPRSGSDYVWMARTTHPSIGFAWSCVYVFGFMGCALIVIISSFGYAISTSLATYALLFNVPSLYDIGTTLASPIGAFVFGTALISIYTVICIMGAKAAKALLYAGWIFGAIAIISMWLILGSTNPTAFAAKWDMFLSKQVTYQGIFDLAKSSGWTLTPFSMAATVTSLPIALLFLFGANWTNMIAGEVRNVKRAVPAALMFSTLLGFTIWVISAQTTLAAVGENWISAIGYLWDNAPAAYSSVMPYPPSQTLLIALTAYPNQLLVAFELFMFVAGNIAYPFIFLLFPTRYFFAWSFDRVIPTKLADVNQRFRTPHYAIIGTTLLGILELAIYYFTSYTTAFAIGTFAEVACWVIISLSMVVFIRTKPDLLDQAPVFMRKKIAGLPTISWVAVLSTIAFTYVSYLFFANPLLFGIGTTGLELMGIVAVFGFILYYASLYYHKHKGIEVDLAFKEIPPV